MTAPRTVRRVAPVPLQSRDALVSVVIPCFDYARFVEGAIRSALTQDGVEVEVIVVDDASTDASAEVARAVAERDARVRVVVHGDNRGPVDTFNDGLALATGDYLVRLDADDLLTPGSLRRAVAVAQAFPTVGLVYGHPIHVVDENFSAARTEASRWTIWRGRDWLADRCRSGLNVITSPEVLMRKSVVDEVGGQMPLAHTHDMEMWLRIAAFADVAYIHGADQAWHRDHPHSLSSREVDPLRDLREKRAAFDTLFDGAAGLLPDAGRLREDATRAVAEFGLTVARGHFDRRFVDLELVERYVEFAKDSVAEPSSLRGWETLQSRIRRTNTSPAHPAYVMDRLQRKMRIDAAWRRWHRNGVF